MVVCTNNLIVFTRSLNSFTPSITINSLPPSRLLIILLHEGVCMYVLLYVNMYTSATIITLNHSLTNNRCTIVGRRRSSVCSESPIGKCSTRYNLPHKPPYN